VEVEIKLRAIQCLCLCCYTCDDDPKFLLEKDYEIVEVIGQGLLGVVHKCIHRTTREQFSCKKMPITKNEYNEISMLESHLLGRHPGILTMEAYYYPEIDR